MEGESARLMIEYMNCKNYEDDELREKYGDPSTWDSWEEYIMTADEEQKELVKSIKNRCEIFLLICEDSNTKHLWATLCEDIFQDAQSLIFGYCIKKAGSDD